ncbi:helix-turn-helix domain-containing protein [Streptomonospora salina]|uniref:Transcriptional regulator with XRE-family HTH domain n=1 Tax=Streptomonospora salina TaxID=104205 RepID=A0A841E547_9ACTN|nr:helix-turn-helix transcriptional regulator [Streptomonospora salina]MBB5998987.1 transcriptional regulator with XRE-family HTH domain [Streptomonospora salina]
MNPTAPQRVAGLLKQAREHANLSQSALAAATAVPQPNISDYESGKRSPTVRTLLALLDACDVELELCPRGSDRAGAPG